MHIVLRGKKKLIFHDLRVGNCHFGDYDHSGSGLPSNSTAALTVKRMNTLNPEIIAKLEYCHPTDISGLGNNWELAMDYFNTPVTISFDLLEPEDGTITRQEPGSMSPLTKSQFAASYNFQFNSDFYDKFKVILNLRMQEMTCSHYNNRGFPKQVPHNLQFQLEELFDRKDKKHEFLKNDIDIRLSPSNGFNSNLLKFIPQACFVRDPWQNKKLRLWQMGKYDNVDCFKGVEYNENNNSWRFGLNFTKIMESKRLITHKEFVISCEVMVCGNLSGNTCSKVIEGCGYGLNGPEVSGAVPTENTVLPY